MSCSSHHEGEHASDHASGYESALSLLRASVHGRDCEHVRGRVHGGARGYEHVRGDVHDPAFRRASDHARYLQELYFDSRRAT